MAVCFVQPACGPDMKAINCPEAAPYIKRVNRAGWVLA